VSGYSFRDHEKRDPKFLTTTILWIHATAGALWIGACACFVIAGLALTPGSSEQRNFAVSASPKIDRLAMLAAAILLLTGFVNLAQAGISRRFAFSTAFTTVLAIKILLYIAMLAAMRWSIKIGAVIRAVIERGRTDAIPGALNRMVKAHAAIVAMGGIALLLGLWLIGS
jgi:putative copper export protein